jgi:hypothetical protein
MSEFLDVARGELFRTCPKNSLHFVLDLLYIIKETIGRPKPAVSGHFNDQFVPDSGKRGNYREILETV